MTMKLSFNTWAYSSFPVVVPAYPLEETIKRIARVGYDGLEIGAASPHAYPDYLNKEQRRRIKQVLEGNGLALSSMLPAPGGGPGFNAASPLPEERRNTVEQYRKVIDLCAEWGGKTVIYLAGWQIFGTPRQQAWEWSLAALREIAPIAADRGVTLVIEPQAVDTNLVEGADDAIQMMREAGAPNVKLMFDTIHVMYRNEVPTDYVYQMGQDLAHVHLSDIDRLPPGTGRGDFVGLVAALKEIGYDGYLTMEIGFHRRDIEPDLVARQAYDYIKPLLEG